MRVRQPEQPDPARLAKGRARRCAGGAGMAIVVHAAAPLLSLAVTPYALSVLGVERFGLFVLALSVCGWLALLDPGLAPGLRVVLARRSARLDPRELRPLLGAAALGQNVLAALTLAAGAALAALAPPLLGAPLELHAEAKSLFLLVAAGTAVSVIGRRYSAALDACQWMSAERAIRLGQAVLRLSLLALLLACGWGLAAAGWSFLAACAAGAAASALVCRRLLPELPWRAADATRTAFAELARPGAWLSLGAVAGVLIGGVDKAVAARAVSLEAVTTLALSAAAFLLVEAMAASAVDAARPALAQSLGAGDREEARRLYLGMARAVALAAPLGAAAVFAANRAFVSAWAGPEVYGGGALDLWFGLALTVNLWSLPHRAFLSAGLKMREPTLWRLGEGALNLSLSIALALRFGLAGVAAGTALAGACTSLWALPRLAAREAGVAPASILRPFAQGLAVAASAAPLAWLAREAAGDGGFPAAALAGAAVAAAGGALWWRIGLTPESRRRWLAAARARRSAWQAA